MVNGAYIRVALSNNSGHLKIIPSTFGAIFRRKKDHKWPDGAYYYSGA